MLNISTPTMRKIVRLTSGLFLNSKCPLWLQRKGLNMLGGYSPLPKKISILKKRVGSNSIWWFFPEQQNSKKVILFFHGGGYGIGSPRSHRALCAYLASYANIPVASLAYRLAPEHPYPAAIDDALLAYQELLNQGIDHHHIVLSGDSAGGGLALALAIKLKDLDMPQPACMFLISPWVNKSQDSVSHITQYHVDPVINEDWSIQMANNYLHNSEAIAAEACLANKDYTGLPDILIHVGTDEVLLNDSLLLKQKAISVGVKVRLIVFPELWHVFHFSPNLFKPARKALKQAGQFIADKIK